jgi:hypothetical protein
MVTYTVETNTLNKAIKTIFFNYLWLHAARTVSSFSLGQTGLVFQPRMKRDIRVRNAKKRVIRSERVISEQYCSFFG